jgi:hypothetical protein
VFVYYIRFSGIGDHIFEGYEGVWASELVELWRVRSAQRAYRSSAKEARSHPFSPAETKE